MSGGRYEYKNDYLCQDIFGWCNSPNYGLDSDRVKKIRKDARNSDPFEDKVISELVYDVFCLIHSLDWWQSGDTSEETYREDVEIFKAKWLKSIAKNKDFLKERIDGDIEDLKAELYRTYGIES